MAERLGKTDHKAQRKGITKNQIIELIIRGQGKTTWSDLLKKLGISKPTLFEHLDDLKKQGTIESVKIGKRSFYKLTREAWRDPKITVQLFSLTALSIINRGITDEDDEKLGKISEEALLKDLSQQIGTLIIFSMLKSIERKENWYDTIAFYLWQGAQTLIERKMKKPIDDKKLRVMYDVLKKLSPDAAQFEEIYQNPGNPKNIKTGEPIYKVGIFPGRQAKFKTVKVPSKKSGYPW